MKPLRSSLLVLAVLCAAPALAMPLDTGERAKAFATCLGRYAAAAEHAVRTGGDAETSAARREMFADLLDAVTPGSGVAPSRLSSYRLGAKNAQARLFRMSYSTQDVVRARMAASVARREITMCDQLILG
ncbi:hypothetical protein [Citreimonas salinaria]|uniref:Uncharacterized protein n=1 Tax=Citreimonas salinaria TaxID=321339 RepID=A0A1H3G1R5_9RHOB|nr:hypothetical protein [Citreimonas salinaria]SDX96628.1 hypothetical protein SAMN05444340_10276 [Citreimonas salinaria]